MGIPIPFVLGWLLIGFAGDESMLLIGRCITGVGLGAVSLTVPVSIPFVRIICKCNSFVNFITTAIHLLALWFCNYNFSDVTDRV